MSKAPTLLSMLLLALAGVAGALLVLQGRPSGAAGRQTREFQGLVGGLGFGPALNVSHCEEEFDPRLCPTGPNDWGAIPDYTP